MIGSFKFHSAVYVAEKIQAKALAHLAGYVSFNFTLYSHPPNRKILFLL